MTKAEQRRLLKFEVATMAERDRNLADKKIIQSVLSHPQILTAKSIFCFLSASGEPDTITLVREFIKMGKKVGVPKCTVDTMKVIEIDENCDFTVGSFGIIEPVSDKELSDVEVAITPLVAFDKTLCRLGKGKGYYDRFFAQNKVLKVGIAYSCQEVEKVVCDEHDQKLDFVLTEKGTFTSW